METIENTIESMLPASKQMFSVEELAELTGFTRQYFYDCRHKKTGGPSNSFKLGGSIRYARRDVIDWIRKGVVTANNDVAAGVIT